MVSLALLIAVQPTDPIAGIAAVVGYAWALLAGGVVIPRVIRTVPGDVANGYDPRLNDGALGIVERAVYVTAIFEGRPEFIVGWLVLKGAISWSRRRGQPGLSNRYLVEAGLSLAFGVSGGALALHLGEPGNELVVLGYVLLPLILCGVVAALSASWAPTWLLQVLDPGVAQRRGVAQEAAADGSVAGGDLDTQGNRRSDRGDS